MSALEQMLKFQQSQLDYLGQVIRDFGSKLQISTDFYLKKYSSSERPDLSGLLKDITQSVNFDIETLNNFYTIVQKGVTTVINDTFNMQQINSKLIGDEEVTPYATYNICQYANRGSFRCLE